MGKDALQRGFGDAVQSPVGKPCSVLARSLTPAPNPHCKGCGISSPPKEDPSCPLLGEGSSCGGGSGVPQCPAPLQSPSSPGKTHPTQPCTSSPSPIPRWAQGEPWGLVPISAPKPRSISAYPYIGSGFQLSACSLPQVHQHSSVETKGVHRAVGQPHSWGRNGVARYTLGMCLHAFVCVCMLTTCGT